MIKKLLEYCRRAHVMHRGYALMHTFYFSFVMFEGHGLLVWVAAVLAGTTLVAVFKGAEL